MGNQQTELFKVDQWGVHKCAKCGALGTIVQMGKCCAIAQMAAAELQKKEHAAHPYR